MFAKYNPLAVRMRSSALLVAIAVIWMGSATTGCSKAPPSPQAANATTSSQPAAAITETADDPPSSLVDLGEMAKQLFDSVHTGDWPGANEHLEALSRAADELPRHLSKVDLLAQLHARLTALRQRVADKEQVGAMDDANSITRLAAELLTTFQTAVPYDVSILGYFGRQLEIGIARQDPTTLRRATADLRQAWNREEPVIMRRGHGDEATRFTDIVVTLEGAQRPADFVVPTRTELAAVDRLEALFASAK